MGQALGSCTSRHLGHRSSNPASAPAWGLLFGVACEGNGYSRTKIRLRAVQVTVKAKDSALGLEAWGRAVHYEDWVFCWTVINKNLKLSSALLLHSKCRFEEGTEILWIELIMVLSTRCTILSQPFLRVMTSCRVKFGRKLKAHQGEVRLNVTLKRPCRFIFAPFLPLPRNASTAVPASLPRSTDSQLHSQLDSPRVKELVL